MSINIEVTHVTPAGANIFAELGFGEDEAKERQAQAQAQIAAAHALKVQLMHELTQWMTTHQFKPTRVRYGQSQNRQIHPRHTDRDGSSHRPARPARHLLIVVSEL